MLLNRQEVPLVFWRSQPRRWWRCVYTSDWMLGEFIKGVGVGTTGDGNGEKWEAKRWSSIECGAWRWYTSASHSISEFLFLKHAFFLFYFLPLRFWLMWLICQSTDLVCFPPHAYSLPLGNQTANKKKNNRNPFYNENEKPINLVKPGIWLTVIEQTSSTDHTSNRTEQFCALSMHCCICSSSTHTQSPANQIET